MPWRNSYVSTKVGLLHVAEPVRDAVVKLPFNTYERSEQSLCARKK